MKSTLLIAAGLVGLVFASCAPQTVYVPVPYEKPAPKKVVHKPKPRPVETAEGFRAVERPTTYSN